MKKLKVVHYLLRGNLAGVQVVVKNIISNLRDKYDFTVFVGEESGTFVDWLSENEVHYKVVPTSWQIDLKKDFLTFKKLVALLRKERPDILHLHSAKPGFLGRWAAKFVPVKTIYHVHGFPFKPRFFDNLLYQLLEGISLNFTDAVIVMNEEDYFFANRFNFTNKLIKLFIKQIFYYKISITN